jgi:hypothetical protein
MTDMSKRYSVCLNGFGTVFIMQNETGMGIPPIQYISLFGEDLLYTNKGHVKLMVARDTTSFPTNILISPPPGVISTSENEKSFKLRGVCADTIEEGIESLMSILRNNNIG